MAVLDVWVAKPGDAGLVDDAHWIVRVDDHHGVPYAWAGQHYDALEAPHAHWAGTIPPGTYVVSARRKKDGLASDHAIVVVGCDTNACVRLFVPKERREPPPRDPGDDRPPPCDDRKPPCDEKEPPKEEPQRGDAPALTSSKLERLAAAMVAGAPEVARYAEQARTDWRRALRSAFALTPAQEASLRTIDDDVVARIQRAVVDVLDRRGHVRARLPEDGHGGEVVLQAGASTLSCRCDAACRGWRCA